MVDEAIYSLYPDTSGDIVKRLYPDRYVYAAVTILSAVLLQRSRRAEVTDAGGAEIALSTRSMAQVKPGNDVVQPKVRKAFPDTAYWAPEHAD